MLAYTVSIRQYQSIYQESLLQNRDREVDLFLTA
jgi:hypothetical protein